MRERFKTMIHRRNGVARALNDHVDTGVRDHRLPVLGNVGITILHRAIQRCRFRARGIPAHAGEIGARRTRRQVSNAHQVYARCTGYLGQIHGAEFACAYQADTNRLAIGSALFELVMQAHDVAPSLACASTAATVLPKGSNDVSSALAGTPFFQGVSTG